MATLSCSSVSRVHVLVDETGDLIESFVHLSKALVDPAGLCLHILE